ncbi:hypothetical protein [Flavobacterium sp. KACC 22761]|uniref:hypothetical protein n=1 Tax=Flavobacterium sp. KACC 22761 TaxID=3092665 RepID=UPI002A756612|nr:hypothetical protein [Flavobacterium sp. KACC 22761]WPO79104.1 hypothetical protein SCB73_01670 [Flavobacterium sp. KACC 22761]
MFLASCKNSPVKNDENSKLLPPKIESEKIRWATTNHFLIDIDTLLSYEKEFECDSVIGVNYIGFDGYGHSFYPINKNGKSISTIKTRQKLERKQILKLNAILGNKKTFKNPNLYACYNPRLGFIYFKDNKIICQTQICLECSQLESTAKTAGIKSGAFNEKARKELRKLSNELGLNK